MEDAISEDTEPSVLDLNDDHSAINGQIVKENGPKTGNIASAASGRVHCDLKDESFLVLEV